MNLAGNALSWWCAIVFQRAAEQRRMCVDTECRVANWESQNVTRARARLLGWSGAVGLLREAGTEH